MMHANALANVDGTWRYVSALDERVERGEAEPSITAFTQDGYHRKLRPADIHRFADGYDGRMIAPTLKPTLDYVITEPYEFNRTWETASNYTRYRVHPGTYRVEWVTIHYRPWTPDMQGDGRNVYYARIEVKATKLHSYWVNRVFTESSSHTEQHNEETTYVLHPYAYEARPDRPGYVLVEEITEEISPAARLAELETTAEHDKTRAQMSPERVRELEILRELAGRSQL